MEAWKIYLSPYNNTNYFINVDMILQSKLKQLDSCEGLKEVGSPIVFSDWVVHKFLNIFLSFKTYLFGKYS
jgi:hypothetical protein